MKHLFVILCFLSTPLQLIATESAEKSNETQLTDKLNGTTLTYTYSGGWKFTIKYSSDGVSYTMHNYNTPWSKLFPYKSIEVSKDVYFTSWFDTGRNDYVTHLIDLNKKHLYGSVLLDKKKIHFEQAIINEIKSAR